MSDSGRKEAERQLDRFFRLSLDMLCIAGFDGFFKHLNPAWERTLGFTTVELLAKPYLDFVYPEDREATLREAQKLTTGADTISFTNRYLCKDGSHKWLGWNATPMLDEQLIYAIARDITEMKLAQAVLIRAREEEARSKSEMHYRELVENATYGIYRSTTDGTFLYVNSGLAAMLGYQSKDELLAANLADHIYGNPSERSRIIEKAAQIGRLEAVEVEWKRKDGKPIKVHLSERAVRDEQGQLEGFEAIVENVTEQRSLEQQFRQAQKMEAVGRLSGGIAHDFNNLLGVIIGYSEFLEERLDQNDQLRKNAEEIKKAGQRAASLTRQLLAFSRQQVLEPRVVDLNTVVAETEKMLRRLIGEDIALTTALASELGRVKADQGQIEQVIVNLAVNARDAMPHGGKLILETANVELDEAFASQHSPTVPGRYVMLAVTDTGVGMEKEVQAHIFEPFFTTKGKDKGTGLGLSVVYGVVKQSGGYIWVYSEPGKGTTFKIYLPLVEEAVEKADQSTRPAKPLQGSETILLVEDEESLRHLTRTLLIESGYTVLEAKSGTQALEIARAHRGTIHLLLTDMVMPGMSGDVLADQLSLLCPDIKVLFMSGYTDYAVAAHGALEVGTFLLQKPFTRDALMGKVREVLDPGRLRSGRKLSREQVASDI